jgi:hypothetical protein
MDIKDLHRRSADDSAMPKPAEPRVRVRMNRIQYRLGLAVSLVAAALTFGVTAPGTASADTTAHLDRTLDLTAWPTSATAPATVQRSIKLAAGNYTWGFGVARSSTPDINLYGSESLRTIDLAPGWYSWECTLAPYNNYSYKDQCTLKLSGYPTATLFDSETNFFFLPESGSYMMRGYLKPLAS